MAEASSIRKTRNADFPKLPDDVVVEILSLLPVKSLLRFRSVCKNWCSLFQNPSFVAYHHNRSKALNRNESILLLRDRIRFHYPPNDPELPVISGSSIAMDLRSSSANMILIIHYGGLSALGPCNGIICLTDNKDIILTNPATREFKTLPLSSMCEAVGFGYDLASDDYKVVRIFALYDEDPNVLRSSVHSKLEIYNLSTDTWRKIDVPVPVHLYYFSSFLKFFNGAFHWHIVDLSTSVESIGVFDMKDEIFQVIALPEGLIPLHEVSLHVEAIKDARLMVWNNSLALLNYKPSDTAMYFELWVMKEYGVKESWTKEVSFGPLAMDLIPLRVWKDYELVFVDEYGHLLSCDLRSHEVKELEVDGVPGTHQALLFIESLVSVKRLGKIV